MKLTPTADDIWLNAMVRLGNQKLLKIESGLHLPIIQGHNNTTLYSSNVSNGRNDVQINDLNRYYEQKIKKKVF